MKIKSSGQSHKLYRYAGTVEGKSRETNIGTVAVGTKPSEVPPELVENLTPKEMRELVEFLQREQFGLARTKLSSLADDIESAAGLITDETLDEHAAEKLAAVLSRCKSAVNRVQRSRQSVAAPDVQTPGQVATEILPMGCPRPGTP
jgi:hypothetical protein